MAGADKLKDDTVGLVDAKAPDIVMFRAQFFGSERRMKRIVLKQVGSSGCFPLNLARQLAEQAIEGGGGRYFDHRHLVDQFP